MAKKSVIEIVCDRCERVEYIAPEDNSPRPDLVLAFGSKPALDAQAPEARDAEVEVKFNELCSSCKNTVRNLVAQIGKKIDWRRKKGTDGAEGGEAVEIEVGS